VGARTHARSRLIGGRHREDFVGVDGGSGRQLRKLHRPRL
jgi:hypothetical protein